MEGRLQLRVKKLKSASIKTWNITKPGRNCSRVDSYVEKIPMERTRKPLGVERAAGIVFHCVDLLRLLSTVVRKFHSPVSACVCVCVLLSLFCVHIFLPVGATYTHTHTHPHPHTHTHTPTHTHPHTHTHTHTHTRTFTLHTLRRFCR